MNNDTSWIKVGAECVVYSYGGGITGAWAKATEVTAVGKKYFRVEGYNHLIQLDNQTHQGSNWSPSTHVIPIGDPKAAGLLREEVSRRRLRAAQADVRAWLKDPSLRSTAQIIQSLERLHADQQAIARHAAENG